MASKIISVMGCGWLGWPLAKALVADGYTVKGSTTTPEKCAALKADGISPYLLKADASLEGEDIKSFFQADTLFLNIPFRRRLPVPSFYAQQIASVVDKVLTSPIHFVIFASSTSVYPSLGQTVLESDVLNPDNERSQVLLNVEDSLLKQPSFDTTVLRFAGLYGAERRLGRFRSGHTGLTGKQDPVNLVHLDDCVEIAKAMIQQNIRGEVFNVCSDGHPTREELYTRAAEALDMPLPEFIDGTAVSKGKIVSNEKLKQRLKYRFLHPDPLSDVEA